MEANTPAPDVVALTTLLRQKPEYVDLLGQTSSTWHKVNNPRISCVKEKLYIGKHNGTRVHACLELTRWYQNNMLGQAAHKVRFYKEDNATNLPTEPKMREVELLSPLKYILLPTDVDDHSIRLLKAVVMAKFILRGHTKEIRRRLSDEFFLRLNGVLSRIQEGRLRDRRFVWSPNRQVPFNADVEALVDVLQKETGSARPSFLDQLKWVPAKRGGLPESLEVGTRNGQAVFANYDGTKTTRSKLFFHEHGQLKKKINRDNLVLQPMTLSAPLVHIERKHTKKTAGSYVWAFVKCCFALRGHSDGGQVKSEKHLGEFFGYGVAAIHGMNVSSSDDGEPVPSRPLERSDWSQSMLRAERAQRDILSALDKEGEDMAKRLRTLHAKQKEEEEAISRACAAGIGADMKKGLGLDAIKEHSDRRLAEAESRREEVRRSLESKKAEYTERRSEIRKRRDVEQESLREFTEMAEEMRQRKRELEGAVLSSKRRRLR